MALEKELETYYRNWKELEKQEGKFVLIKGNKVHGVYSSYEEALKEGYRAFGTNSFLVKQISEGDQPQIILALLTE